MSKTFKMVHLVGTSEESYEDAIGNAVRDASRSLHGLAWFEVQEMRGRIAEGDVSEYQVKIQVGFKVDD